MYFHFVQLYAISFLVPCCDVTVLNFLCRGFMFYLYYLIILLSNTCLIPLIRRMPYATSWDSNYLHFRSTSVHVRLLLLGWVCFLFFCLFFCVVFCEPLFVFSLVSILCFMVVSSIQIFMFSLFLLICISFFIGIVFVFVYWVTKRKFKQWRSTIKQISIKRNHLLSS